MRNTQTRTQKKYPPLNFQVTAISTGLPKTSVNVLTSNLFVVCRKFAPSVKNLVSQASQPPEALPQTNQSPGSFGGIIVGHPSAFKTNWLNVDIFQFFFYQVEEYSVNNSK